MAEAVLMPKTGITVESCIIEEWKKQVGDQVKLDEILFTYETDKAVFECPSTAEGELLEIYYLDAPPAIVGAQNWITPPFEFDEFYSPSKEWIMDAIHEQLLPLENYVPTTSVTDVERMRRLKAGV